MNSDSFSANTTRHRLRFSIAVTSRCIFWAITASILATLMDAGVPLPFVILSSILGVIVATWLAQTSIKGLGIILLMGSAPFLIGATSGLVLALLSYLTTDPFPLYSLQTHIETLTCFFSLAGLSTAFAWRSRHAITLEMAAISLGLVYLFSGHRNFNFQSPSIVGMLAWSTGISPLSTLISIGILLFLFNLAHLFSYSSTPILNTSIQTHSGKKSLGRLFLLAFVVTLITSASAFLIHSYYGKMVLTRTANGVGQERQEKLSPLGFHSALGASNQPAALVRLDGDYQENPFSPMLYLRETALSEFNGKELVIAGGGFDPDVANSTPSSYYEGKEDASLIERIPVNQSVYLLSEHSSAFAIDFPLSITPLKNPRPDKFRAAYKAYSMAPAFPIKSLMALKVGNPSWDEKTRNLYNYPHPDHRYKELADEIAKGAGDAMQQVLAVTSFLSQNAIYTLTPGHEVGDNEDPVAPFLFGDRRGYCVHFAHATVYLLRALGIPSRIGTGYLTDLSQAKDGHILLRMSDRHAWGEVYVEGHGWVPFDVKPSQVESHAETAVDMKLLEDLMNMLGPSEEALPKDIGKNEVGMEAPRLQWLPSKIAIFLCFFAVFAIISITKIWLIYGWHFVGSPRLKLFLAYRSFLCRLCDAGYTRQIGETRSAFQLRATRSLGVDVLPLTASFITLTYSSASYHQIDNHSLTLLIAKGHASWRLVKPMRRIAAALNPSSVASYFTGGLS